ncbi:alpha/beta fold hydrolase [Thermus brockianus]|uniref:Alpha/beta hydrolase n=1 Tax=Thermus brockianus TaxID=56956 RepID=A0ABM7XHZ9_THEBO|nr:alpha/beta hydrolase [Thermus brockianus]BDG15926.1 alpha/beta hydrolase [Thermus brockianus]
MGEVRLFPGLLSPPAGLDFLRFPAEEGLHLVAFGEGALEALRAAFREEAKSLVLLSPILRRDALLTAKLRALRFGLERGGVEGFATIGRALFFGPLAAESEEVFQAWREGLDEEKVRLWLEQVEGLGDERRWLRGTKARVLVVQGALDAFTPPHHGQEAADFAKGEALRFTLEGAGHFVPWEAWEEVRSLVADFLLGESFRLPGGLAL